MASLAVGVLIALGTAVALIRESFPVGVVRMDCAVNLLAMAAAGLVGGWRLQQHKAERDT